MPLKSRDQVKTVLGATVLQLSADPGESILIKGIKIYSQNGTYAILKTEKTTVGYFRIDETYGNHLAFPSLRSFNLTILPAYPKNLLDLLWGLGIFKGYPVAEGESFILSGAEGATDIKSVIYDIYDSEDMKNTDPNGSKSPEYLLVNYGDTGAVIDAAQDTLFDNPLNPVEFPSFPFGDDVPAKHQITIHAILGGEVAVTNATPAITIYSTYLKLVKDREVLFDEDRNGLPYDFSLAYGSVGTKRGGGKSVIGDFTQIDPRPPYIFSEPMVFDSGDELNIFITTVEPVEGTSIPLLFQVIGLVETVKRITA